MAKFYKIQIQFTGVRPLMFDRYAGDNNTTLPPDQKMYLDEAGGLIMPSLNIFSMLVAQNTNSVAKMRWGRKAKPVGMAISSYCDIDPFNIPIVDDSGEVVFDGTFSNQIYVTTYVPRVKGGIPNANVRPVLALPWYINFTMDYQENNDCTLHMLRESLEYGGRIGLGTFRPFFGRFNMTRFEPDVVKSFFDE